MQLHAHVFILLKKCECKQIDNYLTINESLCTVYTIHSKFDHLHIAVLIISKYNKKNLSISILNIFLLDTSVSL